MAKASSSSNLVASAAWQNLQSHYLQAKDWHLKALFANDQQRANKYTVKAAGITLDYSKNIFQQETLDLLQALLTQQNVKQSQAAQFAGEAINHTENRAVLHTALRAQNATKISIDGEDVDAVISDAINAMTVFVNQVSSGERQGFSGKKIKNIVNIGIGGSDLGPRMVVNALKDYRNPDLNTYFVSNVDPADISDVLAVCHPDETLFLVVSKTFTTIETLRNAEVARQWLLSNGLKEQDLAHHFAAVSTNLAAVQAFGISKECIFPMWDWVGGRFSLWSAVGLSIMFAIGSENFKQLLCGADLMDNHFKSAEPTENIPVILALLGVWYNNFFNAESQAILPYAQRLADLPAYLQQLDMESNGKCVDRDGNSVDYQTGPIIWGAAGTNGQHAFYQLIHQGTKLIPCDFIGIKNTLTPQNDLQTVLNANYIAQMEALMLGKSPLEGETVYQAFAGNKPTNAIVLEQLDPKSLGALIAMYEHKIFVQGVIWNINSYDQWGVELGKQLAKNILNDLNAEIKDVSQHDSSTNALIQRFRTD